MDFFGSKQKYRRFSHGKLYFIESFATNLSKTPKRVREGRVDSSVKGNSQVRESSSVREDSSVMEDSSVREHPSFRKHSSIRGDSLSETKFF